MKPMLASDFIEKKLKFPLIAQPKIDGVRALNQGGRLVGRSLKTFGNVYTTRLYSQPSLKGMDGEMAAAHETDPALCRLTTSALSTIEGKPFTLWWLFDWVEEAIKPYPYAVRHARLVDQVYYLQQVNAERAWGHLRVVPSHTCANLDQLLELENKWLDEGYEGAIIRDPNGVHKEGRSTPTEGGLLRIKRFIEKEALVLAVQEGQKNLNEATIGLLGQTERSTHQANMVPNGMLGAMLCKDIDSGENIVVAAGSMSHDDRIKYLAHQELIVGHIIKYKTFPKGVKDKPRFPTFQTIRMPEDIS